MRVGINTLFMVPGDVGGTETYLRNTLQVMAADFPDVFLKLFTSQDNDEVLRRDLHRYPQVQYECLNFKAASRPKRIIAEQTLLPWKVRSAQIDVLWSPGYTAPLFCSCPQVVTIPDLQYKSHPEDMTILERKTLDFLVRHSCRNSKAVITISEFSRDEVIRYKFAAPDAIFPVILGVDESFGDEVTKADISQSAMPARQPYILCVAHSYPHKNIHVLVEAYANIQDRITHDLIIVGTARRGEEQVQDSLALIGDPTRVHRLSGLDFTTLKYLYQQADLFVLPSLYEGFGLPVLEAMMAGTLVVTSRKTSIPEVAGAHAIFCDPFDADNLGNLIVTALAFDKEEKMKLTSEAKNWSAGFTWKKTADETMQVLRKVASIHGST